MAESDRQNSFHGGQEVERARKGLGWGESLKSMLPVTEFPNKASPSVASTISSNSTTSWGALQHTAYGR